MEFFLDCRKYTNLIAENIQNFMNMVNNMKRVYVSDGYILVATLIN